MVEQNTSIRDAALLYQAAGISVLPCHPTKKVPAIKEWISFQQFPASKEQVARWFDKGHHALGLLCGAVSGNREAIDIDNKPQAGLPDAQVLYKAMQRLVEDLRPGLWAQLVIERSANSGFHLIYRCSEIAGNTKLAERLRPMQIALQITTHVKKK